MTAIVPSVSLSQISVRGRRTTVPTVESGGFRIVTQGRLLRIASIHDEEYCTSALADPKRLLASFASQGGKADLFTFSQRFPDTIRRYAYACQWDNAAIVAIKTFEYWLQSLPQSTRRNIRLAAKRGVRVEPVPFTDHLIQGIHRIYNEVPIRHGRPFWHFGKSLDAVRQANESYQDRSEFIAAFVDGQIIGFLKMVYVGEVAGIMQILSMNAHQDKRPTNALLAKAVEVCEQKRVPYLQYCKYVYHDNHCDSLTEFKERNGFQKAVFPRYFIPLTTRGRCALALNCHLGWSHRLPGSLVRLLLAARTKYYSFRHRSGSAQV